MTKARAVPVSAHPAVCLPAILAALLACGPALDDTENDPDLASYADPDSPWAGCPESLDPTAVHVMLADPAFESRRYRSVVPLDAPEQACAFEDLGDEAQLGISPTGDLLRLAADEDWRHAVVGRVDPDPMIEEDGAWLRNPEAPRNSVVLYEDFIDDGCASTGRTSSLVHVPWLQEMGYLCTSDSAYAPTLVRRVTDSVLLASFEGELVAFFDDGRALVRRDASTVNVEIVTDQGLHDGVTLGDAHITERLRAARAFGERVVGAYVDDAGLSAQLGRIDDAVVFVERRFPAFDAIPEAVAIDADEEVVVIGRRRAGTSDERVVVLRLGEVSHTVLYDVPGGTSDDLDEAWLAGEQVFVDRLITAL